MHRWSSSVTAPHLHRRAAAAPGAERKTCGEERTKDGVEQPEDPERAEEKLLPRKCETVELWRSYAQSINHFAHLADLHFALSYIFSCKLKSTVYSVLFSSFIILYNPYLIL